MKKIIIICFCCTFNVYAISYEELLELAIINNTTLEISKSKEQEALLESKISTRLENPHLELELANLLSERFFRHNKLGARAGVSQSLLLPSVKRDKKVLGERKISVSKQEFELEKLEFIYSFSMKYLEYKEALKLQVLKEETLIITKRIMDIAQERYVKGTALKSDYLQAKIEHQNFMNLIKSSTFQVAKALNNLQKFANVEEEIILDSEYIFLAQNIDSIHPLLLLTQKKKDLSQAKLKVASHKIDSFEVFSEMENEADENIFRVGISIPLPIFNKKLEEKQLAKIEHINHELLLSSQKKRLSIELAQVQRERLMLEDMLISYEMLIDEQNLLLQTYQKGYGIAKINLLEFQIHKKTLVENKERIIKTKLAIERSIVKTNYLKASKYD